ncbi:3-(cis-5,6-dihydroxycyclohexa-1,3-dien-1-yl)propanoate dehydrogenase [Streptomyces sp. NPDC026665]|uniref:3-(cis-5,6-dihydroxycyclohexa-1, 3-dien-1-yl)propanoate dehydrogenase n=1 Tax=Streptomyces sp. NPDC026665 TaxID=3154798 RepID=UPI0033DE52FC
MGRLDDTSVLVTGGGSGLGLAVVERFVDEGAAVTAFDRSADKLRRVQERFGARVRTVHGDVTSPADNAKAVETAVETFGALDVLVANAGVWDFGRGLTDSAPEELAQGFDELFAVNVKGYLLGARAAAEALKDSEGSMIFTLSNASFFPGGGGPLYVASKHAGVGLVRQLAYELAPHIRVNGIAPGGMATDLRGPKSLGLSDTTITDALPLRELMIQHSALAREVTAQDYVGPYVLLASGEESVTVTGTVFDISSHGTPRRPGS